MQESIIANAEFDPKVKKYWLLVWALICIFTGIGILLLPFVLIIVLAVSQKMLDAMSATLKTRKLVVKRGILFTVEKSIPLEKITDVAMSQGPIMRLFGLYRLNFETAGQSNPGALVSMIGIVDADQFREKILEQKDQLGPQSSGEQAVSSSSPVAPEAELSESLVRIESLLSSILEEVKQKRS